MLEAQHPLPHSTRQGLRRAPVSAAAEDWFPTNRCPHVWGAHPTAQAPCLQYTSKRAPCPFQTHLGAHKLGHHSLLPTQGFVGSDQLMRCQGEKACPYLDIQVKRREKAEPRSASSCRSLAVTGLPLIGGLSIVG